MQTGCLERGYLCCAQLQFVWRRERAKALAAARCGRGVLVLLPFGAWPDWHALACSLLCRLVMQAVVHPMGCTWNHDWSSSRQAVATAIVMVGALPAATEARLSM
jgi:hypothetical protein